MADEKPPVIKTAVSAWVDTFRAIGAMPILAGVAFALVLAMSFVSFAIIPDPNALAGNPWFPVVSIGSSIVGAALLAPLAVAVHRFVLLGETTNRYPLEPASRRYQRFVSFAILVKILWLIPNAIQTLALGAVKQNPVVAGGVGVVVLILSIAITIIVVRRAILFPAIAIDAPGATWRKAGLDTKGNSWRVAFIFVLTALPVLVIGGVLYWLLLSSQAQPSTATRLCFSIIMAVVEVPALCAFAVAASHIYRARANVMTRPGLFGSAELQAI